ncbi:hypothetical protein POM88_008740 [Heracleum sosnowskyi]|uniref:F-box domain-containing protein n=1 Tax=Heracleum sosnowskyi TaxID=360622 RepID=A0AAD8JAJ0_9APIA|nr:hypothetical protein POM88_008740 [Heracleum sosnowskyi]
MAGYLPEEMVREVLLRLPVKSLLVCKSVCKPWLSTISNPHFVKSQLHRALIASGNNPTLLEIEEPQEEEEEDEEPDEDFLLEIEQREQLRHQHLFEALLDVNGHDMSTSPIRFHRIAMPRLFSDTHQVFNTCYNGILCVTNWSFDDIYLWNPSIRQCKKVPPPKPSADSVVRVESGFGYDCISDDYVVIRVVYDSIRDVIVPMLQLYSSNSDSWTEFHPFTAEDEIQSLGITTLINGILYCTSVNKLVSFDFRKQVFVLVPFPKSIHRRISNVLDFKGSVGLVFESDSQVDLWTLDDISGEGSWTKRFSIEADLKLFMYVRCFLGAGQFYGCKSINGMFLFTFFYDYEKRVTKYYRLGEDQFFPTFNYTETLVSLNGFKKVE